MNLINNLNVATQNFLKNPDRPTKIGDTKAQKSAYTPSKTIQLVFAHKAKKTLLDKALLPLLADWQQPLVEPKVMQTWSTAAGEVWLINLDWQKADSDTVGHNGRLESSEFGRARDLAGQWLRGLKSNADVKVQFVSGGGKESVLGALVGFGLASYKYLDVVKSQAANLSAKSQSSKNLSSRSWSFTLNGREVPADIFHQAVSVFSAINLARHLTNAPAAEANPEAIATALKQFFNRRKGLQIKILKPVELKKLGMGLLLGVGEGSSTGARLVHLRYRPASGKKSARSKNKKPLAFVGKGVTFDTGGLDIKTASGMRLMKKDMAGAAAMAGLCHFVSREELPVACDFYLPLAENAISANATRPGDVHRSAAGHLVEIDNTDAEGRLVMADAIHYAVNQTGVNKPEALFDISTLTGAMRVAVGLDVAGFFSNSDRLAQTIEAAAYNAGEMAWRMPLVKKYFKQLNSQFADFKNSSDSGYGGAITAALFLEKFIGDMPWVHFDVMSWNLSADGAVSEGANAQCVQTLIHYLLKR